MCSGVFFKVSQSRQEPVPQAEFNFAWRHGNTAYFWRRKPARTVLPIVTKMVAVLTDPVLMLGAVLRQNLVSLRRLNGASQSAFGSLFRLSHWLISRFAHDSS